MVEIIIQFERHAVGLTLDADKSDIPRWRGTTTYHHARLNTKINPINPEIF
jgi:hypothetical protein